MTTEREQLARLTQEERLVVRAEYAKLVALRQKVRRLGTGTTKAWNEVAKAELAGILPEPGQVGPLLKAASDLEKRLTGFLRWTRRLRKALVAVESAIRYPQQTLGEDL